MNAYEQIRYALIEAKGWLIECLNKDNPPTEDGINEAIDRVDAVLALPRRNCDVGTAKEQDDRFYSTCKECSKCNLAELSVKEDCTCNFLWAQMPYEAEEGGAK